MRRTGSDTRHSVSLTSKLRILILITLLPMAAIVLFLLNTIIRYNRQYDMIVHNVVTASAFNLEFKSNLDYKMYRRVVGGVRAYEFYDPREDMEDAWEVVNALLQTSTHPDSLKLIRDCAHFLTNLQKYIDNIRPENSYGYNMDIMWDSNIRVVTELIQDRIKEYIFLETTNLAGLQQDISLEIQRTAYLVGAAAAGLLLILWLAGIYISRSISRPIQELCQNIQVVGDGDLTFRPVASHSREIVILSNSFRVMLERMRTLMEDIRQEQVNLRRTELKLLQAQINPHFLYNTFDTIIWLAEDRQTRGVVEITTSLSRFFRTTLSRGQDFIPLEEEILHIRSYLEIQKVRYRDILEYEIVVPRELHCYRLPKLTLQPLVENALYHGIKFRRGVGKITVRAEQQGDRLLLQVEDDGIGMTPEALEALNIAMQQPDYQKGFGLANVHERIRLYYGPQYGVHIESERGKGTRATVTIALQPETS